jgi:hypothetical protein
MTTLLEFIGERHNQHDDINDYTGEYMKSMEAGDGKKVIGKIG